MHFLYRYLTRLSALAHTFSRDRRGQGLVEYGLLTALVAIALIATVILLRGSVGVIFRDIANRLPP